MHDIRAAELLMLRRVNPRFISAVYMFANNVGYWRGWPCHCCYLVTQTCQQAMWTRHDVRLDNYWFRSLSNALLNLLSTVCSRLWRFFWWNCDILDVIYTTSFAISAATVKEKKKQCEEITSKSLATFANVHNLY